MDTISSILILIVLGIIALQDFRYRAVSWYLFPLGVITLIAWDYSESTFQQVISYQLINVTLLILQLGLLALFFRLKGITITKLFKEFIGLGDLLFFMLLALGLPTVFFICFFFFTLIISLLAGHLFFKKTTTPLAGIQAALLFIFICLDISGMVSFHQLNNLSNL